MVDNKTKEHFSLWAQAFGVLNVQTIEGLNLDQVLVSSLERLILKPWPPALAYWQLLTNCDFRLHPPS